MHFMLIYVVAELEANPSAGLSLEQLDQQIERRQT
jgi:hypothetical protein